MFSEEVHKHFFGKFLAKRDSAFSEHRLHPKEHSVSTEPSSASSRKFSCGVHPHMNFECPSPVPENAVQTKHLRSRTHQPIVLAQSNHGLSFAVRANGTATQHQCTTRNILPGSDAASVVCVTPGLYACHSFCHLNDRPRTHCIYNPMMRFTALGDFKMFLVKATASARSELLRATPASRCAKLLVAATAVRAYRTRHIATLVHKLPHTEPNYCEPHT